MIHDLLKNQYGIIAESTQNFKMNAKKLSDKIAGLWIKNGVPCFVSDREGDQFDESDIESWTVGGRFARRWESRGEVTEYQNEVYHTLCHKAAERSLPVMDIACGPGLGLIPDIYAVNPDINFLATDACSVIVEKWSEFFSAKKPKPNIDFAAFDACNMPINDNSIPIISSNIGFGSLRTAGSDQINGLTEAFRVLKPGGFIFTIEKEFADRDMIQKVFDLWGQPNWFAKDKMTWHERFEKIGFIIDSEEIHLRKNERHNWVLAEKAVEFGFDGIETISKAYVLRKPGTTPKSVIS
jgi:ubiquinone/menaquinone biosynthesis C-methylase UbiE